MATYLVLTQLAPAARKTIDENPDRLGEVNAQVRRLGATILEQYAVLGEYDFMTLLEAADNAAVAAIAAEIGSIGTIKINTFPAIQLDRFAKSLSIKPYR